MTPTVRTKLPALAIIGCLTLAWPLTAAAPTAKPEEVGLSADRLKRINELVQRHIAAGSFSGAVTLVARNGRIGHHDAHGLMDLETRKPMAQGRHVPDNVDDQTGCRRGHPDDDGRRKVRLQDPVSKFIPEWKDMTVAVALPAPAGARGGGPAPRREAEGPRCAPGSTPSPWSGR